MSLLPRKEISVALCPDKVVVVAWTKWLRRRVVSQAILPATPSHASDWLPALKILTEWLADNELGKADVTILLSNCFVRFAMLPFSDDVSNRVERLTIAGLLFESIYGEAAKQWKLALDDEEYGEPSLVAAMDAALWDALNQVGLSGRLRKISVRPYAASVVNAFRNQILSDNCLLTVIEHGQAIFFKIKGNKAVGVLKANLKLNTAQEISSLLQRELLISGLSESGDARVYLHIAGNQNFIEAATISGVNLVCLQNDHSDSSAAADENPFYEMAFVEGLK